MKTYFSKVEQKWVSEIPVAYWLGIYDIRTGEKIYSDEAFYYEYNWRGELTRAYQYPFPIQNARKYYKEYGCTPGADLDGSYKKNLPNENGPEWMSNFKF